MIFKVSLNQVRMTALTYAIRTGVVMLSIIQQITATYGNLMKELKVNMYLFTIQLNVTSSPPTKLRLSSTKTHIPRLSSLKSRMESVVNWMILWFLKMFTIQLVPEY
jgi:hypothetical protein